MSNSLATLNFSNNNALRVRAHINKTLPENVHCSCQVCYRKKYNQKYSLIPKSESCYGFRFKFRNQHEGKLIYDKDTMLRTGGVAGIKGYLRNADVRCDCQHPDTNSNHLLEIGVDVQGDIDYLSTTHYLKQPTDCSSCIGKDGTAGCLIKDNAGNYTQFCCTKNDTSGCTDMRYVCAVGEVDNSLCQVRFSPCNTAKYECTAAGCVMSTKGTQSLIECLSGCSRKCGSETNTESIYAKILCDNTECILNTSYKNLPTLCNKKKETSCKEMRISPDDMDYLAKEIAKGGDNETNALFILNTVNKRYISKVLFVEDNNRCPAFNSPVYDNTSKWKSIDVSSSINRKSKKYTDNEWGENSYVTNIKGCGWWGRGSIQTTGPCNYHILQTALDKIPKYQNNFNLCKTPDLICNTTTWPELKWISGFVYWLGTSVQYYNDSVFDFSFNKSLSDAANSDISNNPDKFTAFVNATSGLVNRGCPELVCQGTAVDSPTQRVDYAYEVWQYLNAAMINQDISGEAPVKDNYLSILQNNAFENYFNTKVIGPITVKETTRPNPYTYAGFLSAVDIVLSETDGGRGGIGGYSFMGKKIKYFLVNLAVFLGQCRQETLQYGACDENNASNQWDLSTPDDPGVVNTANTFCDPSGTGSTEEICHRKHICKWMQDDTDGSKKCQQYIYGKGGPGKSDKHQKAELKQWKQYPIVSSCGQNGESYADICQDTNKCPTEYLNNRIMVATTNAVWSGAPGPLLSLTENFPENITYYWYSGD